DGGDVVDGLVDEAEQEHLHDRHHHGDDEDAAVAPDVEDLLAEDRDERAHHERSSVACSVRVTKTCSRDGVISRRWTSVKPAAARRAARSASGTLRSMTAWTASPKMVA